MTFLAPAAGLVAAGIAVPALLMLYFLKLRRRQLRVSSTLLWSRAIQDLQVNTPFRWLRLSILFLLQLLALASLITAFARPALVDPENASGRIVFVIDRSASMSALDGAKPANASPVDPPVSRLEHAKQSAIDTIRRLSRRSSGWSAWFSGPAPWQACVITFASRAEVAADFTADAARLIDAVNAITPTDQPGDLPAAWRLLDASLGIGSDEAPSAERPTVHLYSDGSFDPTRPAPPPRAADVQYHPCGGLATADHDNLAIASMNARRDYDDPSMVRVFVRIQNAASRPIETAVGLIVNGERQLTKVVTVPASLVSTSTPATRDETSDAAVTFELQTVDLAILTAQIDRSDLLASDNSASVIQPRSAKPRVLVVAPGGTSQSADTFLVSVLEAIDTRSVRFASPDAYELMASRALANDTSPVSDPLVPEIRDVDLVVFDRVAPRSLAPVPSISFGAAIPTAGLSISAKSQPADLPASSARFVSWRRTHPIMRYVGLDQVLIAPPVVIQLPADSEAWTPLAWSDDGPLIALLDDARDRTAPRRLVVAFDLAHSNWGPEFTFPVFLNNAVESLTLRGESSSGRSWRTSDVIAMMPAPDAKRIEVEGPRLLSIPVALPQPTPPAPATLGQLEIAGLYRVKGAAAGAETLAVNLCDSFESTLAVAERLGSTQGGLSSSVSARPTDREIWPWFVAAAFLLLVLEWFLQAWKMKL